MANNSITGRFRELYEKVKDNLSEESKNFLNSLYKCGSKSLHEYRNNLLEILNNEYLKIINELANEYNISVEELEYRMIGNKWDFCVIAIEKLNESIHKYRSEEEINAEFEKMLEPVLNQSDEETAFWNELRESVYSDSDKDNEESITDEINDYTDEERQRDIYVSNIEKVLEKRLTKPIKCIEQDLNITGQVIDFMLQLYDISKPFIICCDD